METYAMTITLQHFWPLPTIDEMRSQAQETANKHLDTVVVLGPDGLLICTCKPTKDAYRDANERASRRLAEELGKYSK